MDRVPPLHRTKATRRSTGATSTPMMAAMAVVCSPEHTGQAFTGAAPETMDSAQALHPAKPQPPQLAPGRMPWISSIRGSFSTAKILEATARMAPKPPPSTPRVSTA